MNVTSPQVDVTLSPLRNDVPLESIVITDALWKRPARPQDFAAECQAQAALMQALADEPDFILQTLAATVLSMLGVGSSGLSILEDDQENFTWAAIAGGWQPHLGGGTPRHFGPCGDVLDCDAPMLFTRWERRYPYLAEATPLAEEGLLVPFHVAGKAVGTIWAIAHKGDRKFDPEDLRLLTSLSRFASAAYRTLALRRSEQAIRAAGARAEQALRESERQFRLLVNSVTDYALYMVDGDGIVASWNSGAERIKGYAPDEIIGQHFARFCSEEDRRAGLPARSLQLAASQGRCEVEGWRIRKDGSRFWANVIIDPVRDEHGRMIGFATVTRDITERRQAQQALQAAQEQLAHAHKMEALGQLTGGVAHDFNNILMIVGGYVPTLKHRLANDAKGLRAITAIGRAVNRGQSLTRQLLSFSRRQNLRPRPLDLRETIGAMRPMLAASLGERFTILVDVADGTCPVHVDDNELELALLNTVLNARDAMPQGGTITLSAENVTVQSGTPPGNIAGDFVVLSVADTGSGIPADILPKVFDPFFTTKGPGQGTGLGLSQVHGFAHQSGGTVVIRSDPGGGTCIALYLAAATERVPAPQAVAAPRPARQARRVLLVEDNPDVADATRELLDRLGCEVAAVGSAQAALFELDRTPFDLVISDIVMPGGMDGLALARTVRAAYSGLPVLLASGYSAATQEAASEFTVLRKPYDLEKLGRAVADVLDGCARARA